MEQILCRRIFLATLTAAYLLRIFPTFHRIWRCTCSQCPTSGSLSWPIWIQSTAFFLTSVWSAFWCLVPLRYKYSLQHTVLKHLRSVKSAVFWVVVPCNSESTRHFTGLWRSKETAEACSITEVGDCVFLRSFRLPLNNAPLQPSRLTVHSHCIQPSLYCCLCVRDRVSHL
jgi:hypothetical protein